MGIINKIKSKIPKPSLGKITLVISMITLGLVIYVLLFHNKFDRIRLGDKWEFSGVGDNHADDGWLRMFKQVHEGDDKTPKEYGDDGIAAGRFWALNYWVHNGKIHFPAGWTIGTEGNALVFRNGNTRYAMFPGKNVNL